MDCDPKRLLESSELAPAERSVLQSARNQPASYDVERGLARFRTALSAPPTVPAHSASLPSTLAIGVVAAVTLGIVAGMYFGFARHPEPLSPQLEAAHVGNVGSVGNVARSGPQPSAAVPPPSPVPPEAAELSRADFPAVEPSKPPAAHKPRRSQQSAQRSKPSPKSDPEAVPAQVAPQPRASAAKAENNAVVEREPDVQHDDSLDELRGTARVRALIGRDSRAALVLLDRLSELHPHGYFVEERAALQVFALLAAGQRDDAAARARDFLRAHPHSPFAAQLRKISEP